MALLFSWMIIFWYIFEERELCLCLARIIGLVLYNLFVAKEMRQDGKLNINDQVAFSLGLLAIIIEPILIFIVSFSYPVAVKIQPICVVSTTGKVIKTTFLARQC